MYALELLDLAWTEQMFPRLSPDYSFNDVCRSLLLSPCDAVTRLETAFGKRTGHLNAIAFRYGRSGLYYLLKAIGSGEGRYVVLPSYSCVVVAHAVVEAGYKPLFLDNAKDSFQPAVEDYADMLERYGDKIAMIIPTHLFGVIEETASLYAYVKNTHPSVFVLQDCAHGFFCRDGAGDTSFRYGDGALFGMNISKLVNSVKGGMLTLNDLDLATRIRELRAADKTQAKRDGGLWLQSILARAYVIAAYLAFKPAFYAIVYWLQRHTSLLSTQTDYYDVNMIALPSDYAGNMCAFEAHVGLASLSKYDARIKDRQRIAKSYASFLKPYKDKGLIDYPEYRDGYSWSHYPVICLDTSLKDHLISELALKGFEIGRIVDYSIADMACYKTAGHAPCPRAAQAASLAINLPMTLAENVDFRRSETLQKRITKFQNAFNEVMSKI